MNCVWDSFCLLLTVENHLKPDLASVCTWRSVQFSLGSSGLHQTLNLEFFSLFWRMKRPQTATWIQTRQIIPQRPTRTWAAALICLMSHEEKSDCSSEQMHRWMDGWMDGVQTDGCTESDVKTERDESAQWHFKNSSFDGSFLNSELISVIYLLVHPSIFLSACVFLHAFIHLFIHWSPDPSIHLSIHVSITLSLTSSSPHFTRRSLFFCSHLSLLSSLPHFHFIFHTLHIFLNFFLSLISHFHIFWCVSPLSFLLYFSFILSLSFCPATFSIVHLSFSISFCFLLHFCSWLSPRTLHFVLSLYLHVFIFYP